MRCARTDLVYCHVVLTLGREYPPGHQQSILTLCDVQLLTGLSIQIMAYYFLSAGLTAYHWQMAIYLTWFANVTHQAGLTTLRSYLFRHPHERNLRAAFMAALSALLLVSMVPAIYFNWPNSLTHLVRQYLSTGEIPLRYGMSKCPSRR